MNAYDGYKNIRQLMNLSVYNNKGTTIKIVPLLFLPIDIKYYQAAVVALTHESVAIQI